MIIFPCVYFLWFLSEIILNRLLRSGESDKKNTDKNSLAILWAVILLSLFMGGFTAAVTRFPLFSQNSFALAGLLIIIIGMAVRLMAVKQLGRFFTVDVTIRQDHQIMKKGLYKYVRHPSYSGSLLSFVGYGISLDNYLSLTVVLLPVFISFLYRIKIEEKALTDQFGNDYEEYKKTTKRLIPFVY